MATLTTDRRSGKIVGYNVQWCEDKQRRTIHLGGSKFNRKTAERLKDVVERLLHYRRNPDTVPDKQTMHWLQHAPAEIRAKLARAGLIVVEEAKTCQMLWDAFLKHKTDIKPKTLQGYRLCQTIFFESFSLAESIENITSDRLVEWRTSLLARYEASSVSTYLTKVRAVFKWAVNQEWLTKDPTKSIRIGRVVNRSKRRIITMEEYGKLLEACPNQEWRVIIALARIGGLRCPSELQQLRWADVNWTGNRFTVKSPKTERHENHREREVPLFPELRVELEKHRSDSEFVIMGLRGTCWHLGEPFRKIADKAGLGVIECPFINMRRSRSNEVVRRWGKALESLWIGHSEQVMEDNYLDSMDEDFLKATG